MDLEYWCYFAQYHITPLDGAQNTMDPLHSILKMPEF